MATAASSRKVALVLGFANNRSIAAACVQSFLDDDFDCIVTHQPRFGKNAQDLAARHGNKILATLDCNIETELPRLFNEQLPSLLEGRKLDAIVHSIAFADFEGRPFSQASLEAFHQAHHISAYSFLEMSRCALETKSLAIETTGTASLTALTYLGAVRAVPNYHIMGPAKASLEAIVRGLAYEHGEMGLRVNAVSAGPLNTLAGKCRL
jgi:enoyl-[acyl-carrier protein] reductase I